ncbi:MAG: tRNA (adenosine(37)-N6)-threonylcarbamoyltransferase complex dimerization subunit type 1 TsaB [Bacteroidales bacterium]|nr:tRNA (adenosine(37)-N6)-threonylcarbamoyltransferase complex dimerization subunit type 1 TsaB [Bacteroidales bacterium]
MNQVIKEPLLLYIETSTGVCSVALSRGEMLIASDSVNEEKAHARVIAPMTESILLKCGLSLSDTDAVVVSGGPGSYTGLRVGVSFAKGICYGAGKPLISVSSLELLSRLVAEKPGYDPESAEFIIPMIDARRMEVYSVVCDREGKMLSDVEAVVLNNKSYSEQLATGKVVFAGDGSNKFRDIVDSPNAVFIDIVADASGMIKPALEKFRRKAFVDVAYFEPFYLKEFVAGVSKKGLGNLR